MSVAEVTTEVGGEVAVQLAGRGLKAVAIVDDVYDVNQILEPTQEERDQLWSSIEFEEEAREFLKNLDRPIVAPEDINADWLQFIIEQSTKSDSLEKIVINSDYFSRINARQKEMKPIEDGLISKLKLEVRKFGTNPNISDMVGVQVVFIDWRLGADDGESAIENAIQMAEKIYDEFPSAEKPLIVLISWHPDVITRSAEFRKKSHLINGLFSALPKADLLQTELLTLHVLALSEALEPARHVQQFTEAVISQAQKAVFKFTDNIKELTLSDYSNIHVLSLRDDGHPLGDYMCWLLSGYLTDLLFGQELATQRQALDTFDFQHVNLPIDKPSDCLARIYHAAVFDMAVGDVQNHPHVCNKDDAKLQLTHPNLALGDIFAVRLCQNNTVPQPDTPEQENDTIAPATITVPTAPADESKSTISHRGIANHNIFPDLYLLVNAECDLAQSPKHEREISPSDSLFLIPGKVGRLPALSGPLRGGVHRTPLFIQAGVAEGVGVCVDWDLKALVTIPFGRFASWMKGDTEHSMARIARMRSLNALEIQRLFAASFTRIGLPVAPPYSQEVTVTIQKINKRKILETTPATSQARLILLKDSGTKSKVLFTLSLLVEIMKYMINRRDEAQEDAEAKPTAIQLGSAIEDDAEWLKLRQPLQISNNNAMIRLFSDIIIVDPTGEGTTAVQTDKTIMRILFHAT